MVVYLLVAIIPLLVGILYKKNVKNNMLLPDKKRWKYILLAALPMFFLIAFRNQNLGADTGMYIKHFNKMLNTPWNKIFDNTRMEVGYVIFVKLITCFTSNPLIYQVICAAIYLFAVTSFANQIEEDPFFVLFLFCTLGSYMFMFTGTRQCLAISICLFSFRFIKKRKILPFALLMILAFYFHKSSILFIAAYLIYSRKLTWWNILIYIILMAVAVVYLDVIQQWFNDQLEYDYEIEGNTGGVIFTMFMLVITAFSIFIVMSNNKVNAESKGLINIGIIATIFWVLRLLTRVAERPSYYFLPFSFAALVYAINSIKKSNEKEIVKIIVIILAFALYIYRFLTNFSSFVPYSFYAL